ncbi:hypothetical protein FBQ81_08530 [Chloroflexi bacterium CFX6]|nr:hypothetical protein [Chloroflexi bacterium CFX6]
MNLRCSFCQTPFTLGRVEKLAALQHLYAENLNHYDAHCPRCRRATPVLRQKLEMTMPNWREALKELEAEMTAHPQTEAPLPKPEPAPAPQAESKPAQPPAKEKPAKEKPAAGKPASQKPAGQKKAPAGKTTTTKKAARKRD